MSLSSGFIRRPVATTLLAIGLGLSGIGAYFLLPVSQMPNIDIPTIVVSASMAGASPETMSSSVATPLERHLASIASVTEMTSSSNVGSTNIVLQFDIDRDIDGAARDVQAAINAARADLPAALRSNPTYRKINPADQPIVILGISSKSLTPGQIYDQASNIMQQKLSQIAGVGDVSLSGASLPAVRIDLNPRALFKYGIGLEDVRAAVTAANANSPKGNIEAGLQRYQIYANDAAAAADDYKTLIVAYRNGAAVRLQDIAQVYDGQENIRNVGIANGRPAVLANITKQPGANVIETVDNVRAELPALRAALPSSIDVEELLDTTISIRNSVRDVEHTLIASTILVVLVVFLFLRSLRATLVPAVGVPLALLGTFSIMYLLGFSLDNFSLMALIVSTGFVVDNTIVVLENVTRYLEEGKPRLEAALLGAREVTFTVISMSISLVAVFIPMMFLGGIVGRIFHEFTLTITAAIFVSLIVSLTVTPMMCALLAIEPGTTDNRFTEACRRIFDRSLDFYRVTLGWALENPFTIMVILAITIGLNFYLIGIVNKGFFPTQDLGIINGNLRGDQSISFQSLQDKFNRFVAVVRSDPAVATVGGSVGGGGGGFGRSSNSGSIFITLKPPGERGVTSDEVIERLRPKLNRIAGARLFLNSAGRFGGGGRQGAGNYQYTILGDSLEELNKWVPKITAALQDVPELEDVNSDQQDKGLEVQLQIDRQTASRLGLTASQIDNTLYDAFGQRQVSTIYKDKNQYHVVMGVAPAFWQNPETLRDIFVSTSGGAVSGTQASAGAGGTTVIASPATASGSAATDAAAIAADAVRNQQLNALTNSARGGASTGASVSTRVSTMVPLSSFATYGPGTTPLSVNHQGPFVATTFSFGLAPGVSMGTGVAAIQRTMARLNVPLTIHGEESGSLRLFARAFQNLPLLILASIITIYIVLGILYESLVHPLTILSTLPSAGVGAVLGLLIFKTEFDMIAFIGIILLIGIVKKNAIILIDFAIDLQRRENLPPREAIHRAALLRFRPIMMTTMGAILGALPLAIGLGEGSELRKPLGISIVGGLMLSQALTLYTTPVVYLYLERFGRWCSSFWNRWYHGMMGDAPEGHQPPPAPAE
jgi:multidrug efflux pump